MNHLEFQAAARANEMRMSDTTRQARVGIPVDLFFKGHDLLKADLFSDSDPYIILYEIRSDAPQSSSDNWLKFRREVGRTEVIDDNLNPIWVTSIRTRYQINGKQRYMIRVIDDDDNNYALKKDDENDALGECTFLLHDVMVAPNASIICALPTQGSITISAHVSLRGEGMTIERVAVPRTATVVDALQKSTRLKQSGTTDVAFPSSTAFWKALHTAIALAPSSAQAPPHLHIEASNEGDGILVNKVFLIDFLDQWNESVTHTLTLTVGDGSRAFRAMPAMWEQLLAHVNSNPMIARDGEVIVEVESNQDPHRRKVKLPWTQWSNFCRTWDQLNDKPPGDTFGGGPPTVEEQLERKLRARDVAAASGGALAGSVGGEQTADEEAALMFPAWTDRSLRMPCTSVKGMPRNHSSTGTYWTNFMREWTILQAAARNHLPSGMVQLK
jgi:hypothetical protein